MTAPPFTRLGCWSCKLVKCSFRKLSVRSLAYTTQCSDHQVSSHSSSSDTSHPIETLGGNFKVTDDEWKRERMSASLLFARQLKESGFKHDVETYMAIVRLLLCYSGMEVRLNYLFMCVIENNNIAGIEISDLLEALIEEKLIKAVEVLVEVYASVGRFEEAMHTMSQMKSKGGLIVSTQTCNFVLKEMMDWGEVNTVEPFCIQLERNGLLIPNVDTYEILLKGDCRTGLLEEVSDLLEQMERDGVESNASIHETYIYELCLNGETNAALDKVQFLWDFNEESIDYVFAYNSVIQGFVKESKLQAAEYVLLHDMKVRQVVPDVDCYSALYRGYFMKRDNAKALGLRKEMESRLGVDKAEYVVVKSMIQCMCSLGMLPEALDSFKEFMQCEVFLDEVTFNLAIHAACNLGRMDDAMGFIQAMKARKMNPLKMHYRTLMTGYCFNGEPWNALYIFREMMRNGFTPDSTTYHVLARGFQGCGVSLPLYMLFK